MKVVLSFLRPIKVEKLARELKLVRLPANYIRNPIIWMIVVFLTKSLMERKTFIKGRGLCFTCLLGNNISRRCKHRQKCTVCAKFHPTSLHGDTSKGTRPKQTEGSDNSSSPKSDGETTSQIAQAIHTGAVSLNNTGKGSKCSMIVPMYVSHCDNPNNEKLVYALLDIQSGTIFILETTCNAFGVKGTEAKLSLSTM